MRITDILPGITRLRISIALRMIARPITGLMTMQTMDMRTIITRRIACMDLGRRTGR